MNWCDLLALPIDIIFSYAHSQQQDRPGHPLDCTLPGAPASFRRGEQQRHTHHNRRRKMPAQFFLTMKRAIFQIEQESQRESKEHSAGRASEADLEAIRA